MSLPHVAWLVESGGLAGGVKVIYEYASRLSLLGWPTTILSLDNQSDWFQRWHKVKWLRYGSYEAVIEATKSLKPDIVIATWWKTAYVARDILDVLPAARGAYLVQDVETAYYIDPLTCGMVMQTYHLGLNLFTTSHWVERQLSQCHYTGIAIGKWRLEEVGARSREVLAVLRPQALKGFRELAEVARYLADKAIHLVTFGIHPGLRLVGSHRHFKDIRDKDLRKAYSACGVFISTSLHEGLSMTALEAMACGAPVIMFDAQGNMEYARDGDNCLLATSPYDMAEKVEQVLTDRKRAVALGKSGVQTAQKYLDWSEPVGRLAAYLTTL